MTNTEDLSEIRAQLRDKPWMIACLCAAWCDVCKTYRSQFDALAQRHPDKCFAWIDIEDSADLVDAIEIENFPTILIQYRDTVAFLGTMLPDAPQLQRLLASLTETPAPETIKRSSLNQAAPEGWSLRRLMLADND